MAQPTRLMFDSQSHVRCQVCSALLAGVFEVLLRLGLRRVRDFRRQMPRTGHAGHVARARTGKDGRRCIVQQKPDTTRLGS